MAHCVEAKRLKFTFTLVLYSKLKKILRNLTNTKLLGKITHLFDNNLLLN